MELTAPELDRFFEKVVWNGDEDECWTWQGAKSAFGYGRLTCRQAQLYAHRVSYENFVGPVADGLVVDHLCREPSCVNPAHLEPVTQRENCYRGTGFPMPNLHKTHCPKGHPYAGDNLYVNPKGHRFCRKCSKTNDAAWRRRKKERT